jgi:hypothetical protein
MKRAFAFIALGLVSLGALAFDLTLPLRLPSTQNYAEAAAYLRGHYAPSDAVQIWPPWLEEARISIDVAPVLAEEDLATADYPGAQKLWLLELPGAPFSKASKAEATLRSRGATPIGEPAKFGPLELTPWDLHAAPFGADLVFGPQPQREWHEVQYVSRACKTLPIGAPGQPTRAGLPGAVGSTLHLRAGIVGEQAYSRDLETIHVEAWLGAERLADLQLNRTHDPEPAWLGANFAIPEGAQLELRAYTAGGLRPPLCVAAWTTR